MSISVPFQSIKIMISAVALTIFFASQAVAQQAATVLFQNVRVFDGKSVELSAVSHVLVRGNKIEKISAQPIPTDRRGDTVIIDGRGRRSCRGSSMPIPTSCSQLCRRCGAHCRHRLRQRRRREGRQRHADARLHQHARSGRAGVRAQARHRRRTGAGAAHLAVGSVHLADRRPWRFPLAERSSRARPGEFTYSERIGAAAIADNADTVRQRTREQLALGHRRSS